MGDDVNHQSLNLVLHYSMYYRGSQMYMCGIRREWTLMNERFYAEIKLNLLGCQ